MCQLPLINGDWSRRKGKTLIAWAGLQGAVMWYAYNIIVYVRARQWQIKCIYLGSSRSEARTTPW